MNFLAHLLLSENTVEAKIGSILADFINISNKMLSQHFHPDTSRAIVTHREIDRFTDAHPDVMSAIQFFFPAYRHYSRIVVDILFDHYLSVHWNEFCTESLKSFTENIYKSFNKLPEGMPHKFHMFCSRMIRYDILCAYLSVDDLKDVFFRVDKRLKYPVGLQDAVDVCMEHYHQIDRLFLNFFPQLVNFSHNGSDFEAD